MKQLITYEKQCVLCKNLKTYILRDTDVNQMNDKEAQVVVLNMMKKHLSLTGARNAKKSHDRR